MTAGTSVAELIADRIDAMPAGERRAAQTLIANYPLIGLKTVADFSQQAGVSSPTILRFVARLGFQNYPEFQSALQDELAAQLQSPAVAHRDAASPQGPGLSPMLEATLENIRETFRHISDTADRRHRGAARQPRAKAFLVGGRFTDPHRPLHGRASHDHPAQRLPSRRARRATGATG